MRDFYESDRKVCLHQRMFFRLYQYYCSEIKYFLLLDSLIIKIINKNKKQVI